MMWFDTSIARTVVEALFNGLWQGILLCALVAIALAFCRRTNAATRYAVWWVTLVAVACLPFLRTTPRTVPAATPTLTPVSRVAVLSEPVRQVSERPARIITATTPVPVASRARILPVTGPVATVHVRNRWPVALFGLWLVGAMLMLTRLAWSLVHVRRLRRDSTPLETSYQHRFQEWLARTGGPRRIQLCAAENISTPMSLGPVNPLILMPKNFAAQLTDAEFDQVLLHELAHVLRGDNWTNLVQKLAEALLFFHPAVWWTAKRLNLERESACDDWVVTRTGEARPYAACLAKLVEVTAPLPQPILATGIFRGARQISTRIERLLDLRRNRTPYVSRLVLGPALVVLIGAIAVCSQARAVLAGPIIQTTFARIQPVAWAGAGQAATPQPEKQPRTPRVQKQKVEEQLRELEEQAGTPQPEVLTPQSDEQIRALQKRLLELRSERDLDGQLGEAQRQLLQLQQQNSYDLLLQDQAHNKELLAGMLADQASRSEHSFNYQQSNGWWTGLNIRTKGQIEFTDDDADVKSVSPDGYLSIEEHRGWTTRKYEVTPTGRRYLVNGQSQPIDNDARAWLADVLPQVIRDSAIGADTRVKRILKQHGPSGVLDEIDKISSDHAKRVYFQELFADGAIPPDALRRAARQMGREIASDGEKARLFMTVADTYLKDASVRVEYFDAIGTLASDGEHRRVLSTVLEKNGRDKETLLLTLKSAARMASDGEKGRLLMEAADAAAFDDSVSAEFLHTVNTMASDGEHGRVLMALMRTSGVGKDTLVLAMKSAGRMASDGEKGRVLIRASEFYSNDAAIRTAFFNAVATMASDGDHGRVLSALLAKSGLDKETFVEIIRSAARMSSDGEKGRVLRQVAAICPADDAVVGALVQAVETISSDGEYRRVMSAMMGRSDLSAKVGRIKYI